MSRDVAIGIVIGGAVSATLGAAIGKTQKSVEGLQKGMADTKGIKSLIGETQRLQREMQAAERTAAAAGRGAAHRQVNALKGELSTLGKAWKSSLDDVTRLSKEHAAAQQSAAAAGGNVSSLEKEHRALSEAARLAAAHAEVKRAAWQDGKANAALTRQQVLALKKEADGAREASQQAKALAAAKRTEVDAAKAAIDSEQKFASALDKAKRAESGAKDALVAKRTALSAARSELSSAGATLGAATQQTIKLGDATNSAARSQRQGAAVIGATTQQTVKLGDATRQAAQGQQQLANVPLRDKLAANIGKLREMGVEVGNLDRAMKKLQQTEKGMQWQQAGVGKMQSGVELGKSAGLAIGSAAVPTKISGDFQAEIRDIAIKAGVANKAEEKDLTRSIMQAAAAQKMDRAELAQAINGLVTQGMDWKEATGYGNLLGELVKGQKMAPEDASKLIYSFGQNGVKPDQMRKTMGEVAVAGDLGAFESDKMAKFMPELLATTGALGFQGPEAVRYIAASLQAQVKLTGDPDSAANNFKNLLAKITAPDTDKKFADAGVSLQESMNAYMKAGYNPVEAFITLTEKLTAEKDPGQAKKLEELKAKIKNSGGNKQQESESLDAYLKMAGLADILTDQQARSGALAQIKYGGQIKEDLTKIKATDGGKKLAGDKSARDDTSNSRWDAVSADFNATMIAVGDAIRPVTNMAAGLASSLLQLGTGFAQNHPEAALLGVGAAAVTLGVAAKRIVGGAVQWGAGKVLTTLGGKVGAAAGGKGVAGALADAVGGGGAGAGVQRVYVTNWPGGGMPDLGGPEGGKGKPGAKPAVKGGRFGRIGAAVRAGGARVGGAIRAVRAGGLGGAARGAMRVVGKAGGAAIAVGTAAYQVYDTYKNAKTAEAKGKGYGGAAGGLAGGLAGAKVGALVGTMILPGIGTVVGGLVGSAAGALIGTKVGEAAGGVVGRAASSSPAPGAAVQKARPVSVPPAKPASGASAPVSVTPGGPAKPAAAPVASSPVKPAAPPPPPQQHFTFSPTVQVKVMGDAKNPAEIAAQIAPHLKRLFDQWSAQLKSSGGGRMYDPVG
ncbi:MAG: phage tail tape measure protein [Pseudogulbenkiania sp.]|nr:phage tail tape measure protein [Pseudogulbenkiania sp.]